MAFQFNTRQRALTNTLVFAVLGFAMVHCKSRDIDVSETQGIGSRDKYYLYNYQKVDAAFSNALPDSFKVNPFCFGEVTFSNGITLAVMPCDGRSLNSKNASLMYLDSQDTQTKPVYQRPLYLDGVAIGQVEETTKSGGRSQYKLLTLCIDRFKSACNLNISEEAIVVTMNTAGDPARNNEMMANRPLPRAQAKAGTWKTSVFSHIPRTDEQAQAWYDERFRGMPTFSDINAVVLGDYSCESRNFDSWLARNEKVDMLTIGARDRNTLTTNVFGASSLTNGVLVATQAPGTTKAEIKARENYLYFKRSVNSGAAVQYGECILKASGPVPASRPLDVDLYPEDLNAVVLTNIPSGTSRGIALQSAYNKAQPLSSLHDLKEGYYKCQWGYWATYWNLSQSEGGSPYVVSISAESNTSVSVKPFGSLAATSEEPTIMIPWGRAIHRMNIRKAGETLLIHRFVRADERANALDPDGSLLYGECGFIK